MKLTRSAALALSFAISPWLSLHAQQWIAPTPEELTMKSIPEVPGAPAVILYKEETTDDGRHTFTFYTRIKVLTEGGKEYANVELPYLSGESGKTIDNVEGRTIQPDGRAVPFTGRPYQKILEKSKDFKVKETVFTLPEVEVGSIIEYRYKVHLDDHYYESPDWVIQGDLFVRKAHYSWLPTGRQLSSEDGKTTSAIAWMPILPPGAKLVQSNPPKSSSQSPDDGNLLLSLDIKDVPPLPKEKYMLPMASISYRVQFYYSPNLSIDEFWKQEGKSWSKLSDKFIGPSNALKAAVEQMAGSGESPEQKLHTIYAAVMQLENTDLTRKQTGEEQRALGVRNVNNADDVWRLKRGNGDQIAMLFVGMARAAGFKAYLMGVSNRDTRIFVPGYRTLRQLDDDIAIVNVNGKEVFFDPGQRYESYGHLAWKHTGTEGLRQTETGTALVQTAMESYKESRVSRVADVVLDDEGKAAGAVKMTFTGDPALAWRHRALRADETELKTSLEHSLVEMLPGGVEVHVGTIENLTDSEAPLKVSFRISGAIGTATGKRLLVPAHLFQSTTKSTFPEATRELPVDMHYARVEQDAVRYKLPPSLVIESVPEDSKQNMNSMAVFDLSSRRAGNAITLYRNLSLGNVLYAPKEYPDLRAFFGKLETGEQDVVVLTRPAQAVSAASGTN